MRLTSAASREFSDHCGVHHFVSSVVRYVVIGNGFERVSALNMGFGWICSVGANALAKAAKFVSVQGVPNGFVFGMMLQLVMAK